MIVNLDVAILKP